MLLKKLQPYTYILYIQKRNLRLAKLLQSNIIFVQIVGNKIKIQEY